MKDGEQNTPIEREAQMVKNKNMFFCFSFFAFLLESIKDGKPSIV